MMQYIVLRYKYVLIKSWEYDLKSNAIFYYYLSQLLISEQILEEKE